jgi:NADPH:quinone reductase-like Zn-dependent oxidoreductase
MPTVKGYSIRLVVGDEARRKAAVEYVVKGLASGALKPVIDRTFKFDDIVEVHRYLVLCFRNNRPMVFRLQRRFYNARCGRQARS